jgi:L-2-hydroxyglutarate oxidase LhgO
MNTVDTLVVGAGVVGLAIAARLSKLQKNVLIIDKNASFGEETSSRNSEVIHAGIYYPKNSLKAKFCVSGKQALLEYCQQRHIAFAQVGKLIVAQNPAQEMYLQQLLGQAKQNGVTDLTWLSQHQLANIAPQLSATRALLSPSTGILDVHSYMQSLLAQAEQNQALFVAKTTMLSAQPTRRGFKVTIDSQGDIMQINCRYLINSAGLHSEHLAKQIREMPSQLIPKIHWCKGCYFSYSGKSPFNQLVYPVPEPNTLGLGIHATLDLAGQLRFGPDTHYIDELNYLVPEALKQKFTLAIQRYFPQLDPQKLQPAYSGIRAKIQGPNDAFKDFVIQDDTVHGLQGLINLFGIESPGITSSLAIAEHVAHKMALS